MEPVAPVTIPPVEDDKEPIINVIMKITFVLLLLVLIGGLGYIIKSSNKKPATKITPTLTPSPVIITEKDPTPPIAHIQEFTGEILEIRSTNIESLFDGYNPEFIMSIKKTSNIVKGPLMINYAFDKKDLEKIQVKDSSGKIISYRDLIVGQNVKIVEVYDLKEKIYSVYEITILN
ncbi:MAG: hypothetical protein ACD_12C00636G0003 [uncultured bacterium]|nr:MAG: hypothetical protein ACD_12C00636G0003 [uncultured bacterium]